MAHLALNVVSAFGGAFVPRDGLYLPVLWAHSAVPVAQIMLLGFAVGMCSRRLSHGLLMLFLAPGVIAAIAVFSGVFLNVRVPLEYRLEKFVSSFAGYGGCIAFFALLFLIIRCWGARLRRFTSNGSLPPSRRLQFTLLHLFVVISVVCVVVLCSRSLYMARGAEGSLAAYESLREVAVMVCVFALNMLSAVWGTLGLGRPKWRVATVLFVSILLGFAMTFVSNFDTNWRWWLVAMMPLTLSLLPTLIVVTTLLVVRSCGYRLVPLRELRGIQPHALDAAGNTIPLAERRVVRLDKTRPCTQYDGQIGRQMVDMPGRDMMDSGPSHRKTPLAGPCILASGS